MIIINKRVIPQDTPPPLPNQGRVFPYRSGFAAAAAAALQQLANSTRLPLPLSPFLCLPHHHLIRVFPLDFGRGEFSPLLRPQRRAATMTTAKRIFIEKLFSFLLVIIICFYLTKYMQHFKIVYPTTAAKIVSLDFSLSFISKYNARNTKSI